ncbi:glutamate-5-semialdehyde dehydrogenase [Haladaptatus sp. F3-133]|uniref:Gamma-glutamyl phosphate reductase n=1 Tax=Halorutilus salinus TaxID=2487751 RepID=A0A9Q4GFK3_9EURY|nr:glutamate-5-semialdehyde dehydrogenase [Halorutilus salinus]MCX2818239.1 glutamate-5-semialdehyde dehydrogenase [Halorutilus salinus]
MNAEQKAQKANDAALELSNVSEEDRNSLLRGIARSIEGKEDEILDANARDVEEAEGMLERGEYTQALVDRLKLDEAKVASIAEMVRGAAEQDDPIGETLTARELDEGMNLYKVSVPIGVVGSVFESRPDALPQIASLCLKSGNTAVLKGGSEAEGSNRVLFDAVREATAESDAVPDGWLQLIESREDVETLLGMDEYVDLLMPRGSTAFVRHVQDNTKIPVLGHTEGVCHVYVDEDADSEKAEDVAYDAKVDYPAACNAVETVLIHEDAADGFLPRIAERYDDANVEVRGDEATREVIDAEEATDDDWTTEYGDLMVAVRIVGSVAEAVGHINTYGSKHTDCIVTEDGERARRFMENVDSASVFHNVSTRFSDGFRYGLGAEVGISTGKTHARGPVGVEGLTTYKWYIEGDGHVVGEYRGEDARDFTHRGFDGEW